MTVSTPAHSRALGRWRSLLAGRGLLTALLLLAVLWSLTAIPWEGDLLHPGGGRTFRQIAGALLQPEVSWEVLRTGLMATWQTVAVAVAGITLAVALGLPLGIVASGTLARSSAARRASIGAVRLVLAFLRSIHELVWAWLFVVAIGLSPTAAILGLALNYTGILGRIYAELLTDVPEGPLRSLRSTGASERQTFLYGRLPMALPDVVSYTLYRFECGIRSAAIMSFVGIVGLGYQVQLALDDLRYGRVWTLVAFLAVLVVASDTWSSRVRRRLTA